MKYDESTVNVAVIEKTGQRLVFVNIAALLVSVVSVAIATVVVANMVESKDIVVL